MNNAQVMMAAEPQESNEQSSLPQPSNGATVPGFATKDAWEREIREAAEALERQKRDAAHAEEMRIAKIESDKRVAIEREEAAKAERLRIEQEAKDKSEREEAERIERDAKMNDDEKIKEYIEALKSVNVPTVKSKAGKASIASITKTLSAL